MAGTEPWLRWRWVGKAPMVKVLSKTTLDRDIREAGFVDVAAPDVGANGMIAFIVARKGR